MKTTSKNNLKRIVRCYGIKSKTATHVTVRWQEKFVPNPENGYHFLRKAGGWRRRRRTMPIPELGKYQRIPPP